MEKVVERVRLENLMEGFSKGELKEVYELISSFNSFLKPNRVSFETNALLVFLFKNGYIQTKGEK
jgi:hypothetical protein